MVRHTSGGQSKGPPLDIVDALLRVWDFDAHTVQYEGPVRRNKEDVRPERPLVLTIELYDFDNKSLPDPEREAWTLATLAKLPEDFCGYRTSGGFRALTLRETPFVVDGAERWEDWRAYHAGRAEALGAILGAAPDHATDEPNRLFRLPMALRDDGKPRYAEIHGLIGYSTLAPLPYERRVATEVYVGGDARHSLVGAAFSAAGLVQRVDGQKLVVTCPWYREHTGANTGGTFIDDTDDHMGHFVCGHTHCKDAGRDTWKALDAVKALPAVAAELAHWPTPGVLEPYRRIDAPPKPLTARGTLVKVPAGELAAPLGDIPWLIEGLDFAPGRPMLVSGAAGSGKTYALQELALSVAGGGLVWHHFEVARTGPVLHIDVDQGRYATAMRYQLLARGRGIDLSTLPLSCAFFDFAMSAKNGIDPKAVAQLTEAVTGHALCIIDSLRGIAPGLDEQDSAFGDVLQALAHISSITGCAFAVVAHSGHEQTRARGTSAIQDRSGSIYQLTAKREPGGEGWVVWEQTKRSEYAKGEPIKFRTVMDRTPSGLDERTVIKVYQQGRPSERPEETVQRLVLAALQVYAAKGMNQSLLLQEVSHIPLRKDRKLECIRELETRKSITKMRSGPSFVYYPGNRSPEPSSQDGNRSPGNSNNP